MLIIHDHVVIFISDGGVNPRCGPGRAFLRNSRVTPWAKNRQGTKSRGRSFPARDHLVISWPRRPRAIQRRPSSERCSMSDASKRIERYRKLAEECRRLAATSSSTEMRDRYLRTAKDLVLLADVEEQDALLLQRFLRRRSATSRGPR